MTKPKSAKRHPRVFPERVFVAGPAVRLVPFALNRPADRMRVLMAMSAADGKSFGVAFSLS